MDMCCVEGHSILCLLVAGHILIGENVEQHRSDLKGWCQAGSRPLPVSDKIKGLASIEANPFLCVVGGSKGFSIGTTYHRYRKLLSPDPGITGFRGCNSLTLEGDLIRGAGQILSTVHFPFPIS